MINTNPPNTFQALADPTRRHIVELLVKKGNLPASDIYDKFDISHPAISQHLKVLKSADLVTVQKKAQQRIYAINAKKIFELEKYVSGLAIQWNARLDRLENVLTNLKAKKKGGDSTP